MRKAEKHRLIDPSKFIIFRLLVSITLRALTVRKTLFPYQIYNENNEANLKKVLGLFLWMHWRIFQTEITNKAVTAGWSSSAEYGLAWVSPSSDNNDDDFKLRKQEELRTKIMNTYLMNRKQSFNYFL